MEVKATAATPMAMTTSVKLKADLPNFGFWILDFGW
jgi:hypothetical protein